jgi:uncharacterized protein YgbK (DUF1537 family)
LERWVAGDAKIVLFDALDDRHLRTIGRLLWLWAARVRPQFTVGSSGVETGLVAYWQTARQLPPAVSMPPAEPAAQLLVVSGSASQVTRRQIERAVALSFAPWSWRAKAFWNARRRQGRSRPQRTKPGLRCKRGAV